MSAKRKRYDEEFKKNAVKRKRSLIGWMEPSREVWDNF